MKLICDCGNEMEFKISDQYTNGEGYYARCDIDKFSFWESHDQVGIVCKKCGKDIWLFT